MASMPLAALRTWSRDVMSRLKNSWRLFWAGGLMSVTRSSWRSSNALTTCGPRKPFAPIIRTFMCLRLSPPVLRLVLQPRFGARYREPRLWRIGLNMKDLPPSEPCRQRGCDGMNDVALVYPKRVERFALDVLGTHHCSEP